MWPLVLSARFRSALGSKLVLLFRCLHSRHAVHALISHFPSIRSGISQRIANECQNTSFLFPDESQKKKTKKKKERCKNVVNVGLKVCFCTVCLPKARLATFSIGTGSDFRGRYLNAIFYSWKMSPAVYRCRL